MSSGGQPLSRRMRCSERTWARSRSYSFERRQHLACAAEHAPDCLEGGRGRRRALVSGLVGERFQDLQPAPDAVGEARAVHGLLAAFENVGAVLLQSHRRAEHPADANANATGADASVARGKSRTRPRSDGRMAGTGGSLRNLPIDSPRSLDGPRSRPSAADSRCQNSERLEMPALHRIARGRQGHAGQGFPPVSAASGHAAPRRRVRAPPPPA